jgi:hypothetical protein
VFPSGNGALSLIAATMIPFEKRRRQSKSEMIVLSEASPSWRVDTPVDASVYAKGQAAAIEQEATDIEEEIQARARRIRRLAAGDRLHAQMQLAARIKTMERNISQGYREWIPALEADKRVLELSRMGILE